MALYQQGNQKIEIIIRKEGFGGSGQKGNKTKDPNDKGDGKVSDTMQTLFGTKSEKKLKRILWTNATHAFAVGKQIAGYAVEYYVGGLGYSNGDSALQERVSREIEIAKDTTNLVTAVGMGITYGSTAGPVGAVLGALFGLTSQTASLISRQANRGREYEMKTYKENNAIEYKRARAQLNLTTGRLR